MARQQNFCCVANKIYVSVNYPEQDARFNLPKSWQDRVTFLYDASSQDDSTISRTILRILGPKLAGNDSLFSIFLDGEGQI